ncbi:MAG: polysaccharide pyruvyl transferase family protein [Acidobacteriota bacterium]
MRIALFNDAGEYPHVGCRAVSAAHNRMLADLNVLVAYRSALGEWRELAIPDSDLADRAFQASGLVGHLAGVDAVVVNGEGTIHHAGGGHLLTILRGAQSLGLPTLLVNAVFQESDADLATLRRLTDFTVRDGASAAYLRQLGVTHRVVFDSMLEAPFVTGPALDVRGKVIVTDHHASRDGDVGAALRQLRDTLGDDVVYYPLKDAARADLWQHSVADFRTARLVVTARHHGVCLAALAGVPFVALGSNTWKIEGMLALLPGDVSVCDDLARLPDACMAAVKHPKRFDDIRRWLDAARPLRTFDVLRDVGANRVAN